MVQRVKQGEHLIKVLSMRWLRSLMLCITLFLGDTSLVGRREFTSGATRLMR
jgi:hypothetical protein